MVISGAVDTTGGSCGVRSSAVTAAAALAARRLLPARIASSNKPITTTAPTSQPIGPFADIAVEPVVVDGALAGATVTSGALDALNAGVDAAAGAASLALTASLAFAAG